MKSGILRILTAVIILLTASASGSLEAMNWPSEAAVLVINFGANNRGRPVLGMIFESESDVIAAESGEVIFSRNKNDSASRLPSPLGAWTAVDHGDGLISVYSRYDDETNNELAANPVIERQQFIASPGTSGWSSRKGFYFMLFDRRERRWINPAMIITPAQETRPPAIISVSLLNAQGITVPSNNLLQGRYAVVVSAAGGTVLTSPSPLFSAQFAPQRILCSVNGAEVGSLNFEAVSARDGIQMVYRNGLVPAKQIYANFPAYETAEVFLTRGQATLEVIVQDLIGNSRTVVNRLIVN